MSLNIYSAEDLSALCGDAGSDGRWSIADKGDPVRCIFESDGLWLAIDKTLWQAVDKNKQSLISKQEFESITGHAFLERKHDSSEGYLFGLCGLQPVLPFPFTARQLWEFDRKMGEIISGRLCMGEDTEQWISKQSIQVQQLARVLLANEPPSSDEAQIQEKALAEALPKSEQPNSLKSLGHTIVKPAIESPSRLTATLIESAPSSTELSPAKDVFLPSFSAPPDVTAWLEAKTGEPWPLARLIEYGLTPHFYLEYTPGLPDVFGDYVGGFQSRMVFNQDFNRLEFEGGDAFVTMFTAHDGKLVRIDKPMRVPQTEMRFKREEVTSLLNEYREKIQKPTAPQLPETKEVRQARRWALCLEAGLKMPSDTYAQLPRGIGAIAKNLGISRQALSQDLKAHAERTFGK